MRRTERAKGGQRRTSDNEAHRLRVPHDPLNEQVLIAAVATEKDEQRRKVLLQTSADYFLGEGHAAAWTALQELERRGLPYSAGTLGTVGGPDVGKYVGALVEARPEPPAAIRHHVDLLHFDRARAELVEGPVAGLLKALQDPRSSPEAVAAHCRQVGAFRAGGGQQYLREPAALVREVEQELRRRRVEQACYPFGWEGFDRYGENEFDDGKDVGGTWRIVPGLAPGEMTLVTGITGSGKTTAIARMILAQAALGRRVLAGAWEMGSRVTLELLATFSLGMSRTSVMVGNYGDEVIKQVRDECERLSQHVRFFEVPFGRDRKVKRDNDASLDVIHQYLADVSPDVFVADLFRRSFSARERDPSDEEYALERMQAILQETRCHGVLVHQLRAKDLEQRQDKRPTREGIKGSGAWVEVPDTIIGWHREGLWKNVADDTIEAVVLKQRYGKWPLSVLFDWDPERAMIRNGKTTTYTKPGERGALDAFLGESAPAGKDRRR